VPREWAHADRQPPPQDAGHRQRPCRSAGGHGVSRRPLTSSRRARRSQLDGRHGLHAPRWRWPVAGGRELPQVMQCWGDADPQRRASPRSPGSHHLSAEVPSLRGDTCGQLCLTGWRRGRCAGRAAAPGSGYFPPHHTSLIPFRSPAGKASSPLTGISQEDRDAVDPNTKRQFFTAYTSNEVKWAGSSAGRNRVDQVRGADGAAASSGSAAGRRRSERRHR
jgi:hypothetical protein